MERAGSESAASPARESAILLSGSPLCARTLMKHVVRPASAHLLVMLASTRRSLLSRGTHIGHRRQASLVVLPKAGQQRTDHVGVAARTAWGDRNRRSGGRFVSEQAWHGEQCRPWLLARRGYLQQQSRQAQSLARPAPGHCPWSLLSWCLSLRNPRLSRRQSQQIL
jgi:hypothetical protein